MSPDSEHTRLLRLEDASARHGQRLDDMQYDVRAFAPMIKEIAELRAGQDSLKQDFLECREDVRKLREGIEKDRMDRKREKDDRDKEVRGSRLLVLLAVVALLGNFITTAVMVASQ